MKTHGLVTAIVVGIGLSWLVFQVDGQTILTSTYAPSSPFYRIAEYFVLDVALGGDMGGAVDNSAFPMQMIVDYVRVYAF